MSNTPDIPALRAMSAERLTEGDVFWGVVHGQENRKGWATLESEGQPVLAIRNHANKMIVKVESSEGPSNLAFDRDDQVLIEHNG